MLHRILAASPVVSSGSAAVRVPISDFNLLLNWCNWFHEFSKTKFVEFLAHWNWRFDLLVFPMSRLDTNQCGVYRMPVFWSTSSRRDRPNTEIRMKIQRKTSILRVLKKLNISPFRAFCDSLKTIWNSLIILSHSLGFYRKLAESRKWNKKSFD